MKRSELIFAALLVPLDFLAVLMAGIVTYQIRFNKLTTILPVVNELPWSPYLTALLIVAVGWVMLLGLAGSFPVRHRRLSSELGRIFLGSCTAVLFIIVVIFFRREFFASRFMIVAGWLIAIIFLWITHALVRGVQRLAMRSGFGARRLVVIGHDHSTKEILETIRRQPSLGYRLIHQLPDLSLESITNLDQYLGQRQVDEILLADTSIPKSLIVPVIDRCNEYNVTFKYAADVFDTQAANVHMDDFAGIPILEVQRTMLQGWGRILKRVVDLIGAVVGLVIFLIPGLIIGLIIKLDSAGPIFVRLERVGQGQKKFRLWKFRSMIRDAHVLKSQLQNLNERHDGPLFKIANDPRITRIGKFLRKSSLDEIPQLMNVITGEISLVGPRPHEPEEVAKYDKHHKKVLAIKPGVTGLAQVSGRSNLTFEDEVRLDTYYIEHWSLGLDMNILLRTPGVVLTGKSAV